MMTRKTIFILMFFACAALFCADLSVVEARTYSAMDEHDDALQAIKRGEIMSYSQIKRSVENRLGARVVNLRLRRTNKGWRYYLRLSRKDGRVVAATVDAKSGKIISTQ